MRLIDADKIDFNEVFKGQSDFAKDTREAAQSLIDSQPTAYDVDKVVEQINKEIGTCLCEHCDRYNSDCDACRAGRAVEIVKSELKEQPQ